MPYRWNYGVAVCLTGVVGSSWLVAEPIPLPAGGGPESLSRSAHTPGVPTVQFDVGADTGSFTVGVRLTFEVLGDSVDIAQALVVDDRYHPTLDANVRISLIGQQCCQ